MISINVDDYDYRESRRGYAHEYGSRHHEYVHARGLHHRERGHGHGQYDRVRVNGFRGRHLRTADESRGVQDNV